jgi:hypothetical protein
MAWVLIPVSCLESDFHSKACSFMPMLFFPWNPCSGLEEPDFSEVVHIMKKKIL